MILDITFSESNQTFNPQFGEINNLSDAGFEQGYEAGYKTGEIVGKAEGHAIGYEEGHANGVEEGYANGLAARTYETWTITLVDETVIEKEVSLI